MDYQLTLTTPGQPPAHRTVTVDTTADLAQAVHRHARGLLGGQVDVHLDPTTLTGSITSHGATAGEFALEPVEEPEPVPVEGGIRGGWTLADLDRLARAVVSNNMAWWPAGDRDDLHAAAWHGIVEHLYATDDTPSRTALMDAGRRALAIDVRDTMRNRGTLYDTRHTGARYAAYWHWATRAAPSPESGIVERMALVQILPALTPGQRRAVDALAAAGDYATAAELLGVTRGCLERQLSLARRRFRALWHEGETPSQAWGVDRRAGRSRGTVNKTSAVARIRWRANRAEAA